MRRSFIKAFTLIEVLVVIAIIGILATIILVSFSVATKKGRDAKRKSEVAQIGRFLSLSCYLPSGGGGEYDLVPLANEVLVKYPQYDKYLSRVPRDPKSGSELESKYIYTVNSEGSKCALYANLENNDEQATLHGLSEPTPGGGTGILEASGSGWNGTNKYFQYSN